jgi:hypothetical protein
MTSRARATFAAELDPGEEYRASALGRTQRLLDEERRRGTALAEAVRAHLALDAGDGVDLDGLRAALAAWEGR